MEQKGGLTSYLFWIEKAQEVQWTIFVEQRSVDVSTNYFLERAEGPAGMMDYGNGRKEETP